MRELVLLHEDEHLVVVNKPAGMLVVPAPGRTGATVGDVLQRQLHRPVHAVHRIDEETTGCLLYALDEAAKAALDTMFRAHSIERDYLALCTSVPSPASGCLESQLLEGSDGIVRVVRRGGKRAVTHYETMRRDRRTALVRCRLETGRRNQIRAHLAALGCPIAGDRKYGYRARAGESHPRVMLHSWCVTFRHPILGHYLRIEAEPAEGELQPNPEAS
ncbi:MAG: RluA family pseudouridine synthase [Planctomycetota bacterium]